MHDRNVTLQEFGSRGWEWQVPEDDAECVRGTEKATPEPDADGLHAGTAALNRGGRGRAWGTR